MKILRQHQVDEYCLKITKNASTLSLNQIFVNGVKSYKSLTKNALENESFTIGEILHWTKFGLVTPFEMISAIW